jgi:predicted oxidoreductase
MRDDASAGQPGPSGRPVPAAALDVPDPAPPAGSPVILGLMGWGGGWGPEPLDDAGWAAAESTARSALEAALAAGITTVDTADIYAHGRSEETLGRLLSADPPLRDRLHVQTKAGILVGGSPLHGEAGTRYDSSAPYLRAAVAGSLKRLRADRIDTLLIHRPDVLTDPAETVDAYLGLKDRGAVGGLGVSNMPLPWVRRFDDALRSATGGAEGLVCAQVEMGLHRRGLVESVVLANHPEAAPGAGMSGLVEFALERGIGLQAWGPLAQGLFTRHGLDEAQAPAVAAVAGIARDLASSREAVVLGWLMRLPWGIRPVVGSVTPARIRSCSEATDVAGRMDAEQWYRLWTAVRGEHLP